MYMNIRLRANNSSNQIKIRVRNLNHNKIKAIVHIVQTGRKAKAVITPPVIKVMKIVPIKVKVKRIRVKMTVKVRVALPNRIV